MALCAVLSGADDWVAIALFGEQRLKFLRRFLPFENGTPSHDQFGNVFAAIDGKTPRRSFDKAGKWAQSIWFRLGVPRKI